MGWPDAGNRADMKRARMMLAEIMDWDAAVRDAVTAAETDQLAVGAMWDGAPTTERYADLLARLDQPDVPAHPFNPPVRPLSSAANCGGPTGQRFPDNYGIYCTVPPSSMPTRFKWSPNFWPNNDGVSCYFNSVAVTEAGRNGTYQSNPTPWGWWNGAHDFSNAVHSLFALPGNPYVMGDYDDDWAAVQVLIYW